MGLNDGYIADCCQRHPGRIQGLAHVPEWWFPSRTDDAVAKLQRAIRDHGLSGLQFMPLSPAPLRPLPRVDADPIFDPLWATVAELGIPVFFNPRSQPTRPPPTSTSCMLCAHGWTAFPDVDVVMTHGFPWRMFAADDRLHIPDDVYEIAPIGHPRFHDPDPLRRVPPVALGLSHATDAARPRENGRTHRCRSHPLGNGHPASSLLHWTYRQSLDYVRGYIARS